MIPTLVMLLKKLVAFDKAQEAKAKEIDARFDRVKDVFGAMHEAHTKILKQFDADHTLMDSIVNQLQAEEAINAERFAVLKEMIEERGDNWFDWHRPSNN